MMELNVLTNCVPCTKVVPVLYKEIVILQCEDYEMMYQVCKDQDFDGLWTDVIDRMADYMDQWDYGEVTEEITFDEIVRRAGKTDVIRFVGDNVITVNNRYGYASFYKERKE